MNNDKPLILLQDAWRECERHIYHLFYAMRSIHTFLPLTEKTYINLTDEQIQAIDQLILRYTKKMGGRLFKESYPLLELGKELPEYLK